MKGEASRDLLLSNGHDDSVPSVVSASASRAYVNVGGENVHEFSFALVTPLGAENDGYCGKAKVSRKKR
jgi:hypothetical protein